MSDLIDNSKGFDAIAYAGEVPWHGKGAMLNADDDVDTIVMKAGLDYTVKSAPVMFDAAEAAEDETYRTFTGRRVLFRDDTRAPLGIVSDGFKVVQPRTVVEFFRRLIEHNGFVMEVAGALDGGKRVWALARVNDGAPVIGHDVVRPYVLCATGFDGTLATVAKFTAVRVVCANTEAMALGRINEKTGKREGGEKDVTEGAVVQAVRVPHSAEFDPGEARTKLGIALDAFDQFLIESRLLAQTKVDEKFVIEFLKTLLPKNPTNPNMPVEEGRTFKRLLAIWKGEVPSATLPEAQGTAWSLLNAITWDVDHVRGQDESRLSSAWFGTGAGLKTKARDLLVATVS